MAGTDFDSRITAAYAASGATLDVGRGVLDGDVRRGAVVQVPASMMNRHGLIAGATGTGKTRTLQLLAEQLSALGVSVFAADVKGDLSGMARPGAGGGRVAERVEQLGIEWRPSASPVSFLSLGGIGPGVPVRASVSSFGPVLLAKVLGSNETQTSSLALVFRYAKDQGLALVDLDDLRAVLAHLTGDEGKADLKELGGLSRATAGVLLRDILELEDQGGAALFGEPELQVSDLLRQDGGRGVVSLLELAAVQDKPKLFSTFLMWLLAELFADLPEEGDLDQPKLVFFFDEAHLLFDDADEAFVDRVAQTVRLIRSKGVGVFFVTQLPDDVPEKVLSQLGNRVQHALRAFTPRDAKALKAAVTTYPDTADYDLEEDLTQLGTGDAMVTILSEGGAPTPVVWTRLRPPASLMDTIGDVEIEAAAEADPLFATYGRQVDRPSAADALAAREAEVARPDRDPPAGDEEAPAREVRRPRRRQAREPVGDEGAVVGYLKSREGRTMVNTVVRGVFGLLRKRR
jgi:DNA helicase HerA-like ATPase